MGTGAWVTRKRERTEAFFLPRSSFDSVVFVLESEDPRGTKDFSHLEPQFFASRERAPNAGGGCLISLSLVGNRA